MCILFLEKEINIQIRAFNIKYSNEKKQIITL